MFTVDLLAVRMSMFLWVHVFSLVSIAAVVVAVSLHVSCGFFVLPRGCVF